MKKRIGYEAEDGMDSPRLPPPSGEAERLLDLSISKKLEGLGFSFWGWKDVRRGMGRE